MADWWEKYKKDRNLGGNKKSSSKRTWLKKEVSVTDENRQTAKSSTWWEDYKKTRDLDSKVAANRQRAERSQRFGSANRQLEENRSRDAAEDEIRRLTRNPFSSDAEWQAGVLQRNAERYKRDLPLYQQAMQNSSTWGEYFSAHRQAGESQSAVKHQFERYQQAAQKAEQDRDESNLVNRPALYASEHMTPEQISAELDRLRSGAATPTVTDKDRNDPVYAYLYPEAALQKVPHGARFDERLLEGAGQDAIDALYRPILTEQEKAAVEEADRQIIEDKANRNYERVQILKAAQSMQTERTSRETGNQLMEEIATGGAAAKQVETGRAAFEAKQQQIASETSFEIGDDLDSNRGAYNKMQKERRERGYILGYDWDNVPEARKQAVYALYAQDPEKAMELAKYYIADAQQAEDEERQAWYAQSGWTAALGLVSSAAAHLGAAVDPFGDVGQELTRRGDNALAGGSQWADAATDYKKIPEWVPIVGGKGAGDLYQTVGSVVQSAAVAAPAILVGRYDKAAAEIISNLGLALMGSSAAASDYRESVAAGMDEDRAKLHALAAGVEEALFEEVSLDKLIKMDTSGGLKAALKNWLVQSGIEGSEELATSIANRITDEMISGAGQSEVERRASELIANGMNSTQAHTQAESEWMTDTLYEGFSGFLSGGMMTGGNYALQGAANLTERAVNAAETRKAQRQAGAAVSRSEGSVEALQAYAKDKGIEIRGVETAEQNAGESTEQGSQDGKQNSYSARDYRSISDTNSKVVQSIRSEVRGKTAQEQQAIRDSLVEKYGDGIAPAVYNAISIETASHVRQEYGDVDSIQAARNRAVSDIKDESLRRAVSDGYDSAAYSLAASQGGEGGMDTMSRYIQQSRNTGSGSEMSMNAIVTAQDGSTKTIAITGMSEDGKRVTLENGAEIAVKNLQADEDTTSAIQQLADLDLGDDATKVLQAYQQSGVSGTDGYRWLMDYATAYNQGRTRQISLEQAAQRSSLDERTVMDAYTLGQQAANRETQAGLEKLKNLPKRKGASGRTANIDTTEIKGKTMSKSELEQFELANQYAQALGVDMTWFSSREKDGKFVDKNGAYENGKIYMDIHAGRNFAADLTSGILATMGHELSHFEQQYAPEEYQALKEFLFEQIVKSSPNGEARLERLIWEKQKRSGYTLSRKAAEDEVVADACQKMLRDSKAVHDFASQQPEAANGVVRWLDKWFKRVRSIFGRGGNYSEEAQIMDSLEQDVKAAFGELWDKALKQAVQVHDEVGNIEKPATEGESKAQNSDREDQSLRGRVSELEDQLDMAELNGLSQAEIRKLNNELIKARGQLDTYAANQRRQAKRTSFNEILRNLENYERVDLESLAEQISDSAWDDYDELSDEELIDALRETINERLEDFAPGEADDPKYGLFVKKPKTAGNISVVRYSDRDVEYLELAKDPEKNAAKLQEMVDEAAKRAGYTIKVYHGTTQETISASKGRVPASEYAALEKDYSDKLFPFVVFKENGFHTGIYTATDRGVAEDFTFSFSHGGTIYDLYARSEKPLVIDAQKRGWNNLPKSEAARVGLTEDVRQTLDSYKKTRTKENVYMDDLVEFAKKNNYDAVIVENVRETGSGDEESPLTTDVVVFSSKQLKSADPVTYDDSGNVIPLSERFNEENEDIRYSERDNAKPRSAQAQRDAGYKLSESKFYSLYSAHKLNMIGKGNVQEQISSIMADGFKGDGGFGNNVMPTNISYDVDENGKRIPRGLSAQKYAPKKGEYILLVPKEGVEVKGGRYNFTERVKPGYKPAFDYEIVQADYDGQPYYEMYEKAYDKSQAEKADVTLDGAQFSERDELASDNQVHDLTNRSGETVGVQDGNGHLQFSQRTWRESGKEKMKEYLDERVRKYEANRNDPEGMHPDDAKALMDAVQEQYDALDEIVRQQPGNYKTYEAWADAEVETDIFGNPVFSWLKANGDYGISGDASLICVKRRTLDAVFDYMIRENMIQDGPEGLKLAQESIVAINDIIRAHGFETACSTCYIDARRYRAAIVAGSFCNVYNKLVRSMLKGKTGVPINAFNFGGNKSVTPLANSLDTLSDSEINWDGINKAIRDQEAKWESKGWEKFTEDGEEKWRRNGTVKNLPTSGTTEYRIALALKEKPSLRKLALRSDFLSGNGFLELNRTNKDILTLYNVKKGQAGPKATETDIQYLHEALENSFITPDRMFKAGGFRLQSFSDYVPRLVFDYVEIIGDLAAKGVPAHMYTKEILCVLQHGLTGTKINMSLIPAMVKKGIAPGLDADGNYLWRDGQTFGSTAYSLSPKLEAHLSKILGYQVKGRLTGAQGFELAKLIQNDPAYGKNNGTIAIGVSEAQIRKMLDDADIRMVIPYHKSGLNHILASMMEIPGFENYESYQNTLKWNGTKWAKVDVDFDFNEAVQKHKGDARAAAQDYLDWCEENGYKPKFSGVASGSARNSYNKAYDFTQHADWQTGTMTGEAESNYYKVLADFTCYDADGKVSRQEAVKLNYPGTDSTFGSMKQLIEMGLESDAMLQAKQDAEVPKIVDDIRREIPKFEAAGRNMKAYAKLKENVEGRQYSERDYSTPSDEELLMNASVEEAANVEQGRLLKEYQARGEKIATLEKQLAEARQQTQLTNRALNTRGIGNVVKTVMRDYDITDARHNGTAKNATLALTEGYQKALDLLDKGASPAEVNDAVYNGAVKAAEIILEQGTYSQNLGGKWQVYSASRYLGENSQELIDSFVSEAYADFVSNRYREARPETAADRLVARTKKEAQERVDKYKGRSDALAEANRRLEEKTTQAETEAKEARKAAGELFLEIKDLRQELQDNKTMSEQERKAASKKLKALNKSLEAKREEAASWQKRAKRNASLLKSALESKNRDISALNDRLSKEQAQALEKQKRLETNLEKQIQRERDILAGKLRAPELVKLLKAEREKAEARVKEQKEQVFQNYKERKKAGELRGRIKNLSDEMKRRMTNPTDRAYVPASLYQSMTRLADVLDNVLSPNSGTKAEARYRAMMDAIRGMAREYEDVKNLDPVFASEYEQEISDAIGEIERILERRNASWIDNLTGDTQKSFAELSSNELQQLYDLMRQINYTITNATKIFGNSNYKSILDAQRAVAEQQNSMKGLNMVSRLERKKRLRLLNSLSVMRATEMMAGWDRSAALYQLMHGIEQGADDAWAWVMDYNKSMQDLKTGKNEKEYRQALTKQLDFGITDRDGLKVTMTKMQALQILMTAEREEHNDKLLHLQAGGAVIRNAIDLQNGKGAKARSQTISVTPELIQKINDSLTDWDRAYMKTVRDYFKREGKRTNEILYKLKHKVLKTEEFYVPYTVDRNYLEANLNEQQALNMWVKTPGSTNALKQKAKQPVIIDGMDTVMGQHVKEIGNYIGMAIPIRDFSKVYNGMIPTEGPNPLPVKETIERTFGKAGQHLLTQAVIDVQGGTARQNWESNISQFLNKLQGAFVKSALLINPSVTIKQAASYIAAESVISHLALERGNHPVWARTDESKSFMPGGLIAQLFARPEGKTAQRIYNEIDQYTSLHYQRRQGMSMAEIAEQANRTGPIKRRINAIGASMEQSKIGHAVRRTGENLNPITWIQRMDVATTAALWVACKEQAKLDKLTVGSEEFWKRTTELYERCIRETQPMYDGLHRTANQKQAGGLMQYLFPFRTVPIQNHGQLAASYEAYKAARESKNEAKIKEAGKFFRKTVWAQTESAFVFSVMTFLAAILKRKTKKYRDEEGELDAGSFTKGLLTDVGSTLISVLNPMYGSELFNLGSRAVDKFEGNSGYTYDAFSVGVVDMINDLASSGDRLLADAGKIVRGENVNAADFWDHAMNLLVKGGKLAGIPADTVKTYFEGTKGNIQDAIEGRIPALNDESWERDAATNARRYLKAYLDNDTKKASAVLAELRSNLSKNGKDEGKINEAIRKYVSAQAVEKVADGTWTEEEAEAYLLSTGAYDDRENPQKDAWNAIRKGVAKSTSTDEEYSWKQYDELAEAVANGEDVTGLLAEYRNHGYSDDQINAAIKSGIQEAITAGDLDEEEAADALIRYGVTYSKNGKDVVYDEQAAWKKVQEWADKAEHTDEEGELEDGYKYSAYADLFDAVDANQNADGIIQTMVQNGGYDTDSLRGKIKEHLLERFIAGQITETALKNQLSRYCKISKAEDANEVVANAKCKRDFGVYPDDLKEAFKDGDLSQNQAEKALQQYKGLSKTDAQNRVQYWGYNGDLSENAWLKWNNELKGSGLSVDSWEKVYKVKSSAKGTDANGDGRADSGTVKAEVVSYIDSMNIPKSQKKAIYLAFGWAASTMPNWR